MFYVFLCVYLDDNGPGVSSCRYLGDYGAGECKIFPMNVKMLPPECTAYFFDGIKINQTGNEQSIHFIYNYDNWGNYMLSKQITTLKVYCMMNSKTNKFCTIKVI